MRRKPLAIVGNLPDDSGPVRVPSGMESMIVVDIGHVEIVGRVSVAIGKDAKVMWEKKTVIMYEAHFKKGDKTEEMVLTPDGRRYHEEGEKKGEKDDDEKDE